MRRFGHLGLAKGSWPIIGQLPGWDRRDWAMPAFIRYEELTGRSLRVRYDDDDPSALVAEEVVAPGFGEQGPKDGLLGAGAVVRVLTSLLG
ncbi:MAG TPA: hypothetical protein VMD59_00805 [Acidimicrobiales bacterium]|nr:hypothetical protein [Acidimicrobiales bacterium]